MTMCAFNLLCERARRVVQLLQLASVLLAVLILSGVLSKDGPPVIAVCVLTLVVGLLALSIDLAIVVREHKERSAHTRAQSELAAWQAQTMEVDQAFSELNRSDANTDAAHKTPKKRGRRLQFSSSGNGLRTGRGTASGTQETSPSKAPLTKNGEAANAGSPTPLRGVQPSGKGMKSVKQMVKKSLSTAGESPFVWPPDEALPVSQLLIIPQLGQEDNGGTKALRRYMSLALDRNQLSSSERHTRLLQMSSSMRELHYTLRQFHADCVACFPELMLYSAATDTSSGRTAAEEYKRTIGALFAVYWLMRLDLTSVPGSEGLDGQRGFCFGVDEFWHPPSKQMVHELQTVHGVRNGETGSGGVSSRLATLTPWQKRLKFYELTDWGQLHQLIVDAGMVNHDAYGRATVNVERTAAMLSLTAFHDIMKIEELLPATEMPYRGYGAGERLHDHDLALGYVLEHDVGALPAYEALSPAQKTVVRFTQAELGFNHGWLVQAEAPPGALFARLKSLVDTDNIAADHIAFYFTHWITDLAGAMANPLKGCEKFLTKFPQAVFAKMVKSFSVVQRLANTPPTQLLQDYYQTAWFDAGKTGEALPFGHTAVAILRLVVQMQGAVSRREMVDAFMSLNSTDRELLAAEMARTGVAGEAFSLSLERGGPAFLVYYGPALVRHSVKDEAKEMLSVLAEVYRAARTLWPIGYDEDQEGRSVTVRVDSLKDLKPSQAAKSYSDGRVWVLVKKGEHDAIVENWSLYDLPRNSCASGAESLCVMQLWEGRRKESKAANPDVRRVNIAAPPAKKAADVLSV